jgi:cytochrome c-type biogenesis protein CcmH/NrfG
MKRFRLSTMLMLIVIVALSLALGIQDRNHRRREAEEVMRYSSELEKLNAKQMQILIHLRRVQELAAEKDRKDGLSSGKVNDGK